MFVTSVRAAELRRRPALIAGAESVELRLDGSGLAPGAVTALVESVPVPVLATHHGPGGESLLLAAVAAGAALVDVPLHAPSAEVLTAARSRGCRVVVSHHDHAGTPSREELSALVQRCFDAGADVAKVACHVTDAAAAARLVGLLDDPLPVVALGMGPLGRITRLAGAVLGSPLVFVAPAGHETAPGQFDSHTLREVMGLLAAPPAPDQGGGSEGV